MNLNLKPERTFVRSLAIVFFACAAPWLNADSVTQITIDTSTLAGQTENLVLDFDLGGGTQSNTVSITNFYTDGTLSSIYQAHNAGVTGYLPGNLTFTSGATVVEELYVTETLGNTITFDFDSTNNAPTAGAFPDEFDVYLLDPASSETVLPSNDPSGAGSLLAVDLYGGAGAAFTNFSVDGEATLGAPAAPTAAPEPVGLLMLGLALLVVGSPAGRTRLLRLFRHSSTMGPIAALLLAFAFVPALRAQSPVTNVGVDPNITVTFSALRFIHATNQYVSIATITNVAFIDETIPGPFYLGITGGGGPAYLVSSSGPLPDGSSAVAIPTPAMLGPGQSATINVLFTDPSTKTFTVAAKVWDAASNPPPATLQCPQGVTAPGFAGQAPVNNYTAPTDSVGRVAACIPMPGTVLSTYNPTGSCSTVSTYYAPASCSFVVATPNIAPPIVISGTITLGSPEQTDLRVLPCSTLAGNFSPAFINFIINSALPLADACGGQNAGTTSYSIYNYGPNPAYNFSVTMKFPPGPARAAWRFSQANSCAPPVPQTFSAEGPSGPVLVENGGEDVTCTFAGLDPYQSMDAVLGLDLPSGANISNVPAIEIDLALDPTQNFTTDTGDMSALVTVGFGPTGPITVPASISEKSQPCDYSSSPGFAILLNTCGVPPVVTETLVGTFLGAATVLTGGVGAALDVTEIGSSVIFDANQGAALILTR